MAKDQKRKTPFWLKCAFSIWVFFWFPVYLNYYGPTTFLWLCDISNFIILIALWSENKLLFSSQATSIALIGLCWAIDLTGKVLLGFHPTGGTEYMFEQAMPFWVRLFSLFHLFNPILLIWIIWRIGYDKKGWILQTILSWVIMPICFFYTDPVLNLNWVYGLFGKPQSLFAPPIYLILWMIIYPLAIYFPTHLILMRLTAEH